jgi:hypothetical protein
MGFTKIQSESSRTVIIAKQAALAWLKFPIRNSLSWTPWSSASPLNEFLVVQLEDFGYGETTGPLAFSSAKLGRMPPEPNRLFLAHVLVVVGMQHGCPPVPELVGSLLRVQVDPMVGGGEWNSCRFVMLSFAPLPHGPCRFVSLSVTSKYGLPFHSSKSRRTCWRGMGGLVSVDSDPALAGEWDLVADLSHPRRLP